MVLLKSIIFRIEKSKENSESGKGFVGSSSLHLHVRLVVLILDRAISQTLHKWFDIPLMPRRFLVADMLQSTHSSWV